MHHRYLAKKNLSPCTMHTIENSDIRRDKTFSKTGEGYGEEHGV